MNQHFQLLVALLASALPAGRSHAETAPPAALKPFLSQHCFECHDEDGQKGELDLEGLAFAPDQDANFRIWERVFDRVVSGEMPPAKKERPDAKAKAAFITGLKAPLVAADRRDRLKEGRVHSRRLTRREYEYTLHDLLGIALPLSEILPADPVTHGFETVASGQQLSQHHLARYLEAADLALGNAFDRALKGDKTYKVTHEITDLADTRERGNYRGPELRDGLSIAYRITTQFYGRMPATRVPESGWYRITLKDLQAMNPKNGVVWGTLKSGACYSNSPVQYYIASIEGTPTPRDLVFDAWIRKDHMLELKVGDATIKRAPHGGKGGAISYKGKHLVKQGNPAIAVSGIVVERIHPNATPAQVRYRLFPGMNKQDVAKLSKAERKAAIEGFIRNFATRAFRRPANDAQLAPYFKLALDTLDESGSGVVEALRVSYRAMLCSPRFLTLAEKPGRLDDHAIASRLSYMLWNSLPDVELRRLANKGELGKQDILGRQVVRMLKDPKAQRFITSFTDQWLNLRDINFTSPDQRRFSSWDAVVQDSMLAETRGFVHELFRENLPIHHLVQSDFSMLNERLVRHYNLGEAELKPGQGLQKVMFENPIRGGLITQGAILKVTANGTTTSPVVRGVWVNERLLGTHIPPPPPGVPAIEPDIRGAVSIRDQLAKHRDSESCASCHRKIDPAGFALESFDPVGRWRTKYGNQKRSAVVDPSGITARGKPFKNIGEWKAIYLDKPDQLAKGFTQQLLTYATGAPPRFSDRNTVAKIVARARKQNYGMATILQAVVASDAFLYK